MRDKFSFRFIDLFAGIGGFHQAMKKLGGECVFASEIDENCKKTYSNQFNMEVSGDINNYIDSIPEFDVLCAGFPCQTFSKAGKREGFADEVKGKLFFRIIDILKQHPECKFIILENVRNLADDKSFWDIIQSELIELDFYITQDPIIKSPDYFGVPQIRERVYILGIKKSLRDSNRLVNGWIHTEDLKLEKYKQKCVIGDAFKILDYGNQINADYIVRDKELEVINAWEEFKKEIIPDKQIGAPIWLDYFELNGEKIVLNENIPKWKRIFIQKNQSLYRENKEIIDTWYKKYENVLQSKVYRKFEWNCGPNYRPFKECIIQFRQSGLRIKRSNYYPSLVAIVNTPIIWDKELNAYRRITVRETANLQSFDPEYKFVGNDQTCYKQLGNAVNVLVIEKIAKSLFNLAINKWDT